MAATIDTLDAFSDSPGERESKYPWMKEFKRRRHGAATDCAEIKRRAVENHKFAAPGEEQHPYDGEDDGGRGRRGRKLATMSANEVAPTLAAMCGRQVMGRFERRYIPRRRELRSWSEKLSNWDRAVTDSCHADQHESTAFRNGPGIAGLSWLRTSVDYLEDPDGMLFIEEIPLWQMLWPAKESRFKNLVDRDWHIHGEWYPVSRFKAMWPTKVSAVRDAAGRTPPWEVDSSIRAKGSPTPWDGRSGSSWSEEEGFSFYDPREKQVWVERYEWREVEMRFFVVVPPPGMSYADLDAAGLPREEMDDLVQEMSPADFRRFVRNHERSFREPVPAMRHQRKERMVYRYAFLAGDVVLEDGEIDTGLFTYEAMTGYPFTQPNKVDWRSVTDAMRTPQIWYNIFLTMLVKYMQVNPKGVLFVERGVFRNRAEGLKQFSSTGGVVEMERGKLSGSPNPPFHFHAGGQSPMGGMVQNMMSFAQELLPRSAGFNQGALGQLGPDLRRISGTVVEHVREAAVAAHAELYDSLALARQRIGLLLIAFLGKVLRVEHMERVVGDEAFLEEAYDPTTGEPLVNPEVFQQLVEAGQLDPGEIVEPQKPGEAYMRRVEPPEGLLDRAVWAVAVEETKPAPDRMRFWWESLTESGALQTMLTPDAQGVQALSAEDVAELAPDIPEDRRKKMLERIKMQKRAFAAAQQAQQQAAMNPGEPPADQPAA